MDYALAKEKYLKWMEVKGYAKRSLDKHKNCLRHLERFLAEKNKSDYDLRSVEKDALIEFVQKLKDNTAQSEHSRQKTVWVVTQFFDFLEKEGCLLMNPARDLYQYKKINRKYPKILTTVEMNRILSLPFEVYAYGLRDQAILEVMYSTGIRLSELCALKESDVDFNEGVLFVNQGKGSKDRVVPLGQKALTAVNRYLLSPDRRAYTRKDTKALFLSKRANAVSTSIVRMMVKNKARIAGIKKRIYPHLIRYTCATHLLMAGAPLSVIQGILGHMKLTTTEKYTQLNLKHIRSSYNKYHPQARWLWTLLRQLKNTSPIEAHENSPCKGEATFAQRSENTLLRVANTVAVRPSKLLMNLC